MDNSIYSIVGRRDRVTAWPDAWMPRYSGPYHRRPMLRGVAPGLVLIGLGLALFLAAWAHRRQKSD